MKVLVTGGAGYIGSHVCKCLVEHGHSVCVYDNLSTGHRDFVRYGDFYHGDILESAHLRVCLEQSKAEAVIHLASCIEVGESVINPGKYYHTNAMGSLSVLEAMRDAQVSHIVVSGSCSVYGQPEQIPITESCPCAPVNPYGHSKMFMECMLADFEKAHQLHWTSLRYFNAAGADPQGQTGERHIPESHLIPRALMAAAGALPELTLFGDDYNTPDGTCIRDYIHVSDLALAHVRALERLARGGSSLALNAGSGKGISVREIITAIGLVTGKTVPVRIEKRRAGDAPQLVANPQRAQAELNWSAQNSQVNTIINTAWLWYLKDRAHQMDR